MSCTSRLSDIPQVQSPILCIINNAMFLQVLQGGEEERATRAVGPTPAAQGLQGAQRGPLVLACHLQETLKVCRKFLCVTCAAPWASVVRHATVPEWSCAH
jgi:hypothetical protein